MAEGGNLGGSALRGALAEFRESDKSKLDHIYYLMVGHRVILLATYTDISLATS